MTGKMKGKTTGKIDYYAYIRWGKIRGAEQDGGRLTLRIARVYRHGLLWTGTVTFDGVTSATCWYPRSNSEGDAAPQAGWSLDGLVFEEATARLEVSQATGPGDRCDAVYVIGCGGVRVSLRPALWATLAWHALRL